MHPDTNHDLIFSNDGQSDVDAVPTLANLEWAIKIWAANLIQTKDSSGNLSPSAVLETPLSIFLFGDALETTGDLYIGTNELISGSILDNWLDELEDSIKNQFINAGVMPPDYLPINILIESLKSGVFIQPLSQYGRVILTSTNNVGPSYIGGIGDRSFSGYFLTRIAGGHYIDASFAYAQLNILYDPSFEGQEPQIEATGNGISNEFGDEIVTAKMSLEFSSNYDLRPKLLNGLGGLTLWIPEANLWAYADDPEGNIAEVAATIIPPQGSYEETKTIILQRNPSVNNRYEGVYDRFFGEGVYKIIYTAIDVAGNAASPLTRSITVEDSNSPLDVSDLNIIKACTDEIHLNWLPSESSDAQGYRIYFKPPGEEEYLWSDVGNVHQTSITGLDLLANPGIYEFRVTTYDRVPLESLGSTKYFNTSILGQNQQPIAVAGWNQELIVGKFVQLDGSHSFDPDNDSVTYSWSILSEPSASHAQLSD
ncbi:MAG: hypothetical protein ACTSPF_02085, partial [Candidatus Heimdallarchaeaceae archaeon]